MIETVAIILKLRKARRMEAKVGRSNVLSYLRSIKYEGPYSGVLMGYIAQLLLLTGSGDAPAYIDQAKSFIESRSEQIWYLEYCSCYMEYLARVAADESSLEVGKETLLKPATPFVRRILFVRLTRQ